MSSPIHVKALRKTVFHPRKSYIIIGGLGGFGLELCDWLVDRGAKNIVLTSRSGITTGYQKYCIKRWEEQSANIVISKLNASNQTEANDLLQLTANYGPIGGIFNLALVLKDGLIENQTVENFIEVCDAKVEITKNMDLLSRDFCPELDWFVCFSSVSCGRGNPGQSNYGYANSVMERICEGRAKEGLPGLAIQWGGIADVGILHETMGSDIAIKGIVPQKISSCLSVLDNFLQQQHPVVSSLVPHEPDKDANLGKGDLFSNLASIFGIKDISTINPEATLGELGLDSLMGVELKQILETHFNIVITVEELRELKVKDLKKLSIDGDIKSMKRADGIKSIDIQSFVGKYHASTSNDLVPKETVVPMNAISDGIPVFLIHPFEGSVFMLQSLAELLTCPVYGIQLTAEAPGDSMESLATWYWEHINSLNLSTRIIHLVGYSFGATVAFEMAIQAEQKPEQYPEIRNIILLDGSHNFISFMTRAITSRISGTTISVDEEIVTLYAFSKMFDQDIHLDKKELHDFKTLEDRIQYTILKIAEKCPHFEPEDIRVASNLYFKELEMCFKYNPGNKLHKEICLIKASQSMAVMKALSELYDLEKVCEGKVTAHTLEGNHYDFIQNDTVKDVAKIINEIISL